MPQYKSLLRIVRTIFNEAIRTNVSISHSTCNKSPSVDISHLALTLYAALVLVAGDIPSGRASYQSTPPATTASLLSTYTLFVMHTVQKIFVFVLENNSPTAEQSRDSCWRILLMTQIQTPSYLTSR